MKKYIRTKDGIYEKEKLIYAFNDNEEYLIKNIVKEADTIEELCDKWVFDNYIEQVNVIKDIDRFTLDYMKEMLLGKCVFNVRLAIFTDKGLVYVAKMNDKGELELI